MKRAATAEILMPHPGSDGKPVALRSVNNQISRYDIYDQSLLHQGKQMTLEDKFTPVLNAPLLSNVDDHFFLLNPFFCSTLRTNEAFQKLSWV